MDSNTAVKILSALAAGVDPFSGAEFPRDSTLQHPDVVRALYIAVMALQGHAPDAGRKAAARNPDQPGNAGAAWTEAEDLRLCEAFDAGKTEKELAALHERTLGAIRARLIRLGKLDASANLRD
ncbi:MAG: hypothetical protein KF778_19330 [Rhodocyclaceae bacterium]|nr:hypothetical protein [Rhodocyclaceae bacterium]MBX3670561.1 hypothetical protein [Rhodocyclaceae bacterium]